MIYNFNINSLFETYQVEPYVIESPIILNSIDCNAKYDKDYNNIKINVPNGDEFVCAGSSFKWVEGYPQSIVLAHQRCKSALDCLKADDIVMSLQYIYNMPNSPYYVHLFQTDKGIMTHFNYIIEKSNDDEMRKEIKQYLTSLLDSGKDSENMRKNNPKLFIFVKTNLENMILYLKSKCEVFFWFYQGLPQLSQSGMFQ